jgi:DNA helicase-2/ATP-dependent DNA helicase PcrA
MAKNYALKVMQIMDLNGKILAELNPEQKKAVTHDESSMLVLAGAGSGKTKVLTTRIAWLIQNNYIAMDEILAVTFTNKAAKEMVYRVANALTIDAKHMWIGTFHSISLRLLTKHHSEAGLPAYFQILDVHDQVGLIKRLLKAANLDENQFNPRDIQKFINQQKEHGVRAKGIAPKGLREEHVARIYSEYEEICNREGLVDFTELLLRSFEMLSSNDKILKVYQNQFKHILIDEFQDTNQLQYRWLKLLSDDKTNLFAVGDDDQSIYSFRGAQVSNMQSFLKDFSVRDPIRLEQNYRSTPTILQAANAVISHNTNRIGKNLWTKQETEEKIRLYEGYTEEDEAYFVADEIASLERSGFDLSEIAILYRSNAQSRVFEQFFYSRGIAYRVYGGLRFFDRQEIKSVLFYLRLLLNSEDNEAFLRAVNFPTRGVGVKTIETLQELAQQHKLSLFKASSLLEGKLKVTVAKFTNLIQRMQLETKNLNLSETIRYIIETSGIKEHYEADRHSSAERLENLNELVSAVTNFKPREDENPIVAFLSHAILESNDGQANAHDRSVQLMTVHAAKGLEFKVVFVVGLEDGLFPHENCLEFQQDLEEERRLMYVAITRAKERLYLLRACSRLSWGRRQAAPISRFINEIPGELISNISGISKIGRSSLSEYGSSESEHELATIEDEIVNPETRISRVEVAGKDLVLKIGDMVKHAKFGNGKILRLNVEASKMIAEIFFIGIGKKTLDLNIAKIEKA